MTQKEKAAGVLPAPEAAIQKRDRVIIVGNIGRVNAGGQGASMLQAMQMAGLAPAKALDLVPDGKLRRYRVEGDKGGSTNGWYVLHSHPILAGAFGSWKTGESHNWHEVRAKPPTQAERDALRKHLQAAQAARVIEQDRVHGEARAKAERLWRMARPATNTHPYLERKRINAIGIRRLRDMLLILHRPATNGSAAPQTSCAMDSTPWWPRRTKRTRRPPSRTKGAHHDRIHEPMGRPAATRRPHPGRAGDAHRCAGGAI